VKPELPRDLSERPLRAWMNEVLRLLPDAAHTTRTGTGTLVAGNTTAVIAHGLPKTPAGVVFTLRGDPGPATFWISAIGATTFTVTASSSRPSNILFDWVAITNDEA
jgi:hypothetical protein